MGDYPGRKQVRTRAKRAVKNDKAVAKRAAQRETLKVALPAKKKTGTKKVVAAKKK